LRLPFDAMAVATITFADRLAAEVERKRSQLVVGLDPRADLLPVELRGDVARFCCGIVDAVAPHAVAVKPQLAFFEALGSAGIAAFEQVCQYAKRAELLVIADGKRGDIGSTARAYSEAYLEGDPPRADALTVNPWLGRDAIEPFLGAVRRGGVGIFVLVRTSNAGGDLQDAVLKDGRPMWHHVAELVDEWGADTAGETGLSSVGAVVGATHPRAVAEARRLMPRTIMLLPGVGAQGASVSDLSRAFQSGPSSALVSASRSVIYAFKEAGTDYREAAGAEAARLKREIWSASGW
jgi:orotidine-5'-phosphate decarboxylase